jgi:cysteine desulfurase/selenocysteine lyase
VGGLARIEEYLDDLSQYLATRLRAVPKVTVYGPGPGEKRAPLAAFSVEGVHVSDLSTFLDLEGVAIRAGHHCTQPLHKYLGISHTARASCHLYNSREDIDVFVEKLEETLAFLADATAPR